MNDDLKTIKNKPVSLRLYGLGVAVLWSLLIVISLIWNMKIIKTGTLDAARIEARTAFEKDVIYRRWNAMHGGVYALVTEKTQPNPYLDVAERDIITSLGKKLTKINPAYMTRQVHKIVMKTYGVKGHITSLNPIRPTNVPDPWESQALKTFQAGVNEVSSVEEMEGESYMRLMRPLYTEKGCLKCHAIQGYKQGDIRGGISVSVPMASFMAIKRSQFLSLFSVLGLIWLVGMVGIGFGIYFLNQQIRRRQRVEEVLLRQEKFQGVLEMAGAVCHELNQPMQAVSGYSELLMMDIKDDNPLYDKINSIKREIDRMGRITQKLVGISIYETKNYLNGKIIDIDKAIDCSE
ncbi:MAG: DUF3365 domain-containing protein [Deltaproteobacteria bacterium]|nr:DUF3365 domain-containing protein [Deltaproteobacteria bacterium]